MFRSQLAATSLLLLFALAIILFLSKSGAAEVSSVRLGNLEKNV